MMRVDSAKHVVLISLLAAMVYGSWAAYVNGEHGQWVALRSGLGQGVYALFSTAIVTSTVVGLCAKLQGRFAFVEIFCVSFCVMAMIPVVIHLVLRTPDMVEAILPGLAIGGGYIVAVMKQCGKKPDPLAR